jgi:hypothetical protein
MYERAASLILHVSYAFYRPDDPCYVSGRLIETFVRLRAFAEPGGACAFFRTLIRWIESHCWSTIWRRIQLEHSPMHVPAGLDAEALDACLKKHWQEFVDEQRKIPANHF